MQDEQTDLDNPFAPPKVPRDLPHIESTATGLKITIADILFCMFAVAVALMTQFQPWGGYEDLQPTYLASSLCLAFSTSVFFTANRRRRLLRLPISSFAPGHCMAMLCAGYLATYLFQFLVSYLEAEHVGAPIHILAPLTPSLWCVVACVFILLKTRFSPRWQAFFLTTAAYGVLNSAATVLGFFADLSEFSDPFMIASGWLYRLDTGAWYLAGIFALLAYSADFFSRNRYDWLHHAGVILDLLGCTAGFLEDGLYYYPWLWMTYIREYFG